MKALPFLAFLVFGFCAQAESLPWGSGPVLSRDFAERAGALIESESPDQLTLTGGTWEEIPVVRWTLNFEDGQLSSCTLTFATAHEAGQAMNNPSTHNGFMGRWLIGVSDKSGKSVTYRIVPSPANKPVVHPMPVVPMPWLPDGARG